MACDGVCRVSRDAAGNKIRCEQPIGSEGRGFRDLVGGPWFLCFSRTGVEKKIAPSPLLEQQKIQNTVYIL